MITRFKIADCKIEIESSEDVSNYYLKKLQRYICDFSDLNDIVSFKIIEVSSFTSISISNINIPEKDEVYVLEAYNVYRGWFDNQLDKGVFYIKNYSDQISRNPLLPIMCSLSICLPKRGAILFHCSALLKDDNAFLFSGKSGAGKTTIAAMLVEEANAKLISDDTVILKIESNALIAYSTPFWDVINPTAASGSVKIISEIHKDTISTISKVGRYQSFRYLLQNSFHVVPKKSHTSYWQTLTNLCFEMTTMFTGYCIHFEKNTNFWRLLCNETLLS